MTTNDARKLFSELSKQLRSVSETAKLLAQHPAITPEMIQMNCRILGEQMIEASKTIGKLNDGSK